MKHLLPFALFENEDWTLDEIQRMLDSGLMTADEAAPAMRTVIRKLLAEAGTSEIWSEAGIEALREIPAVAAVREPEAEALWRVGFKPVSSIIQLAQGTLDWQRDNQSQSADGAGVERLVFYERTGYVRQMIGKQLHVLIQSTPRGGLGFFKDKMREVADRFAIEEPFLPSRKTVETRNRRTEAEELIAAKLYELFGEAASELFVTTYVKCLSAGLSLAELRNILPKIERNWPNLPIRHTDRFGDTQWRILLEYLPSGHQLYLITSPLINQRYHWLMPWVNRWQEAIAAGKVDQRLSKPVRVV